jgi:hypothetical protein
MIKLSVANIGGGALVEDIDKALEKVRDDMMGEDPVDGKREVTIKITFDRASKDSEVLHTTHAVSVKLPDRKHGGVAWLREGEIVTEETCRDTTQMEIPDTRPANLRTIR